MGWYRGLLIGRLSSGGLKLTPPQVIWATRSSSRHGGGLRTFSGCHAASASMCSAILIGNYRHHTSLLKGSTSTLDEGVGGGRRELPHGQVDIRIRHARPQQHGKSFGFCKTLLRGVALSSGCLALPEKLQRAGSRIVFFEALLDF